MVRARLSAVGCAFTATMVPVNVRQVHVDAHPRAWSVRPEQNGPFGTSTRRSLVGRKADGIGRLARGTGLTLRGMPSGLGARRSSNAPFIRRAGTRAAS